MPSERLQLTNSALEQLKAMDDEARRVVANIILEISFDPLGAVETAFGVQGEYATQPLLTPVPGRPYSVIWTLRDGKVAVLAVEPGDFDEIVAKFEDAENIPLTEIGRRRLGGRSSHGLPLLSSSQIVAILEKAGFVEAHQKGSHRSFKKIEGGDVHTAVVPMGKKQIPQGTLYSVLRQAGLPLSAVRSDD